MGRKAKVYRFTAEGSSSIWDYDLAIYVKGEDKYPDDQIKAIKAELKTIKDIKYILEQRRKKIQRELDDLLITPEQELIRAEIKEASSSFDYSEYFGDSGDCYY